MLLKIVKALSVYLHSREAPGVTVSYPLFFCSLSTTCSLFLSSKSSSLLTVPSAHSWSRPAPCAVEQPVPVICRNTAREVLPTAPLTFTSWMGHCVSMAMPTAIMACVWPMNSSACSCGVMVRCVLSGCVFSLQGNYICRIQFRSYCVSMLFFYLARMH